jgi:hypothetical protein
VAVGGKAACDLIAIRGLDRGPESFEPDRKRGDGTVRLGVGIKWHERVPVPASVGDRAVHLLVGCNRHHAPAGVNDWPRFPPMRSRHNVVPDKANNTGRRR